MKEEIEINLKSNSLMVRKSFAESVDMPMLDEFQIEIGLADESPLIRYIFASRMYKNSYSFTLKQLSRGLNDKNPNVRAVFELHAERESEVRLDAVGYKGNRQSPLYNPLTVYTRYQFEKGLISQNPSIRLISMQENLHHAIPTSFYPTPSNYYQLERGLKDKSREVKNHWLNSEVTLTEKQLERVLKNPWGGISADFIEHNRLTDSHIEHIFRCNSYHIMTELIKHPDIILTKKQIKRGFVSKNINIRRAFANTDKYNITDSQIKSGLNDSDDRVRASFIGKPRAIKLITPEMMEKMLLSKSPLIKCAIAKRKDIELTDDKINRGLKDKNYEVRETFYARYAEQLTASQIDDGLTDKDPNTRLLFAGHEGPICLTKEQIECALKDHDIGVTLSLLRNKAIILSENQVDWCLKNRNYEIRASTVSLKYGIRSRSNYHIPLTQKQIDYCIECGNELMERLIYYRRDIRLTEKQIKNILKDGHCSAHSTSILKNREDYREWKEIRRGQFRPTCQ